MVYRDIRKQHPRQNDNRHYYKTKHFLHIHHVPYGTMCLYQKRMAHYEYMH